MNFIIVNVSQMSPSEFHNQYLPSPSSGNPTPSPASSSWGRSGRGLTEGKSSSPSSKISPMSKSTDSIFGLFSSLHEKNTHLPVIANNNLLPYIHFQRISSNANMNLLISSKSHCSMTLCSLKIDIKQLIFYTEFKQ